MAKKILPLIIVVLISIISSFSLIHKGFPPTHDGEYHVIRFYEFNKVLMSGVFYPRWAPDLNNGYGVPLFNYVYPLPNYIASFIHMFGISFVDSFKHQLFISTVLGGVFFYLWSKHYFGVLGGILSATLYLFSPYRFVDIFVRGSVGEVWALTFFPAFLWAVTIFSTTKNMKFFVLSSVYLSLVIFSHNILGLMFFIFAFFYILYLIVTASDKKFAFTRGILILIVSLLLSSIFWIPALVEKSYVVGLQIYDLKNNFPDLFQLFIPSWGTGFSGAGLQNQMSFQIGVANILVVFTSFVVLVIHIFKKKSKSVYLMLYFLAWFFLTLFLLLEMSLPVWETIPFMNYFQFPWRLLSIQIIITAFLAGSIFTISKSRVLLFILCFLTVALTIGYAKFAYFHYREDTYYITRSNFIDGTNSPGNYFNTVWFDKKIEKSKSMIQKNNNISIYYALFDITHYIIELSARSQTNLVINTAYFPGWSASIDSRKIEIKPNNNGLITFEIPKGKHRIIVEFLDTPVRQLSTSISVISFVILCLYFQKVRRRTV